MIEALAVVVPARDEEELLPACLDSIEVAAAAVGRAGCRVQIIVVMDACTDGTAELLAARPWIVATSVQARNVGRVRALGCSLALEAAGVAPHRLWIATTDADTVVPADWLMQHLDAATHGWHALAGTVFIDGWAGQPAAARRRYLSGYAFGDGHPHVHGANLGVRGDAYLKVGGFPEMALAEDTGLEQALITAGYRVLHSGRVPVLTSGRHHARAVGGFAGHLASLGFLPAEGSNPVTAAPGEPTCS